MQTRRGIVVPKRPVAVGSKIGQQNPNTPDWNMILRTMDPPDPPDDDRHTLGLKSDLRFEGGTGVGARRVQTYRTWGGTTGALGICSVGDTFFPKPFPAESTPDQSGLEMWTCEGLRYSSSVEFFYVLITRCSDVSPLESKGGVPHFCRKHPRRLSPKLGSTSLYNDGPTSPNVSM